MARTKQCYMCHESFRREELIDYTPLNAKHMYSFCPKCFKEKQNRERFASVVCKIFGIKSPGPRIYTERQRLKDTYGYTDDTIISCLDYIYNVEKKAKLTESLCLVKPPMVDKMMRYRQSQEYENKKLVDTITAIDQMDTKVVPLKQTKKKKEEWNSDDWLED